MDNVQRIQSTLDSRFGVLQSLAQQTADNANQVSATVTALQQKLAAQSEGLNGKLDTASGQAQALNDSVDELKSRITKLDKSIQDLQAQLQNLGGQAPAAAPAAPAPAPSSAAPASVPSAVPAPTASPAPDADQSAGQVASQSASLAANPAAGQAPPLAETFQSGVRDFNAARYDIAAGEFQDVIHFYPLDTLAGTSQFYLGEIAFRHMRLSDAMKDYNAVLEGFPGNQKAPAAQLRKGMALLQMNRKDAGIHEFALDPARNPQTTEAEQARTKLNALGVKIVPTAH